MRHSHSRPSTTRRTLRLQPERLELRQLLAADLGIDAHHHSRDHAHDHEHEFELAQYWLPPTRQLSLAPTVDAQGSEWRSLLDNAANSTSGDKSDSGYRISHERFDDELGVRLVYLQQTYHNLDVVNAQANLAITADGRLVSGYTSFVDANSTLEKAHAAMSPEMALASLAEAFQWEQTETVALSQTESSIGGKSYSALLAPALASAPVAYESVVVPSSSGSLIPAWRLNVQVKDSTAWLDASVSALDGSVLFVANWSSDAQYNVFALPKESPYDGNRSLLTDPNNVSVSPFGWHDTDGIAGAELTITSGNNTYAYRDVDSNNTPDLNSSPSGGASLIFDAPLDLLDHPFNSANASTINLFYVTNVAHDVMAIKGFNAAAGNFQVNNYGAGGLGGDPLRAEDYDGGGLNNANMATPPDGTSPRMQMYLWDSTLPMRNSSFDNGVIVHEFGHGVTTRLTGGPANSSSLNAVQSGGMGEGWSDYYALAFTQQPGDTATTARGIGTYVLGQPSTGPGIRTQPYSYDMSINAHLFSDIAGFTSVHYIGETWASTLWDLHWALIDGSALDPSLPQPGLGYNPNLYANTGGNNVALRLVTQALKLQPANPTFLQARDAILAADQLLYGGAHRATIWAVFARRGMGVSATSPSSSSTTVVSAFDTEIFQSLNYRREGLLGSTLASLEGMMVPITAAGGNNRVTFTAAPGTKTSFVATPTNPAATLTIQILRATGGVARGASSSPTPGSAAVIPAWGLPNGGNFILSITADQPTGIRLQSARNAALESQIGDSNFNKELGIEASSQSFPLGTTLGVVGTSNINYNLTKTNSPTSFVDISTTGTPLNLVNNGHATITTTIGNALMPAGNVVVSNEGAIFSGSFGFISRNNNELVSKGSSAFELLPFWDDIDDETGNVYWQETTIGGVPALIVQWHNRPHVNNIGSTTFQVQLLGSGSVLARYAYADVDFGSAAFNFGASATIGAISAGKPYQFSHNSASVFDGDVIEFTLNEDIDEFRFTAVEGQRLDVALDALGTPNLGSTFMRILTESNAVLATANTKPLSSTTTVSNYDLGRLNFVAPATGVYSVRIYGRSQFNYYLSVTKDLTLDTENSSGNITPVRAATLPGAIVGHLSATDTRDLTDVQLQIFDTISLTLRRVGAVPGATPANDLAPRLTILRPNGSAAQTTTTFDSSGDMVLVYSAVESGRHRIDVRREAGQGDYYILISPVFASIASPAPKLESDKFTDLETIQFSRWQNQVQPHDTNGDDLVTPVDALLLIDELNQRRLSQSDGRLLKASPGADGVDALLDVNGDDLITPLDALLVIDRLNRSVG